MTKRILSTRITRDQSRDTGMAMVLILLLMSVFSHNDVFLILGIIGLVIDMIAPQLYYLIAIVWLGFSHLIGNYVSKVTLSVIFFVIVVPIGLIRKLMRIDSLLLNDFKKGSHSVMRDRDLTYSKNDLANPY